MFIVLLILFLLKEYKLFLYKTFYATCMSRFSLLRCVRVLVKKGIDGRARSGQRAVGQKIFKWLKH